MIFRHDIWGASHILPCSLLPTSQPLAPIKQPPDATAMQTKNDLGFSGGKGGLNSDREIGYASRPQMKHPL